MRSGILIPLFCIVLTASATWAVLSAPGLGAWSVARDKGGAAPEAHAWVLLDDGANDPASCTLLHLPPRRQAGSSDGVAHGAIDGSARTAARLGRAPEALIAHGSAVLLVYTPTAERPDQRMVLSLTAVPSGVADLWRYLPEGRLEVVAALPSRGRVMGSADSVAGPAVLLDEGVAGAPEPRLWVLHRGRWRGLSLEPELARGMGGAWEGVLEGSRLLPTSRGLGLIGGGPGGGLGVWRVCDDVLRSVASSDDPPLLTATFEPQPHLAAVLARRAVAMEIAGRLTIVDRAEPGAMRIRQMTLAGEVRDLGRVPDVPMHAAIVALDGSDRIAAVWRDPPAKGNGRGMNLLGPAGVLGPVRIVEVSGLTGRVLYRGPALQETPVSAAQFRMLVVLMLGVMGAVLLMVLRQPEADAVVLPRGTALAEPWRRFVAGAVDAVLALWASLAIWGLSPGDLLSVAEWLGGPAFQAVLTAAGIGIAAGTVLEGWLGRTPGKWLLGCEVVLAPSSGPAGEPRPPGLKGALTRNLVKWILPPVALLAMLDPGGSGRAAGMDSTRVVIRMEATEEG